MLRRGGMGRAPGADLREEEEEKEEEEEEEGRWLQSTCGWRRAGSMWMAERVVTLTVGGG
jgi:hypothetical protein